MFKLQRLWNLRLCDTRFIPREIPPEKHDFNAWLTADKENKLVAQFDLTERYKLIESYGLDCYEETSEGLRFEINFTNHDYILEWLLSFGGKVKVLEPEYIANDLKNAAENILSRYK